MLQSSVVIMTVMFMAVSQFSAMSFPMIAVMVVVIVISSPVSFLLTPSDLVLVTAAVTFHAVLKILDAFLPVFPGQLCRGMLVTSVTGVGVESVDRVTRDAAGFMILVETEVSVMIEGSRLPAAHIVTLGTVGV